jgi:hypothetical protein
MRRVCDVCREDWPLHRIQFSRRVNGQPNEMEFCGHCLDELERFIEQQRAALESKPMTWGLTPTFYVDL